VKISVKDPRAELTPATSSWHGLSPRALPGVPIDNDRVLDNEGALGDSRPRDAGRRRRRRHRPSKWGASGGASVRRWTVLEALPAFLGGADEAVAKEALKVFKRQGLAIPDGREITDVARDEG